ncbi:MAG: hypothetical protein M1817_002365 [Caeruleum heppii]|nr:MAG: hypothetical protein M1817_002365 [Caeruleum heppii]
MVEAPEDIQKTHTIPEDHLEACRALGLPAAGNAAGNVRDLLDLTGENAPPDPLPAGFTPRGIVALVFSILSAFIGVTVIAWYGVGDLGPGQLAAAQRRVEEMSTK